VVSRYHGITVLIHAGALVHYCGMKQAKAMTIRLSRDQADALEAVAAVDAQPIAEVIRTAIDEHINARRQDRDFQAGLRERLERARQLLTDDAES
jgi:predicted DNA-binding protein